jgi:hypothetical protein
MQLFIFIHVIISLVGVLSGLVVLVGLLSDKRLDRWTALFLATTVATSVTGFCFLPFDGFTPAQAVGILSTVLLLLAIYSRYVRRLAGAWNKGYVITAVASLYLNVFVTIVQSFQKIPALKAAAPKQTELPFVAVQSAALALFVVAGIFAAKHFRGEQPRPTV